MGGVDVITFTAGVGENDDVVRKMVCDNTSVPASMRMSSRSASCVRWQNP